MSDLKIQGEVSLDTTGTDQAFVRVEEGAKRMASAVAKSGKDAGSGTAAIGDGAQESANKFTRAEGQIAASIQRRSALLASAGQGERAYAEARIKNAGLDVGKFEPYLAQLDAAVAKQKAATGGLDAMGTSSKALAANLRGVPAQFTDIITSLQGGQKPLNVLLQQGGQLKDMFGGVGNAAKALGGYVLGLLSPMTIAAGAAAALGYAFSEGSKESAAFNKSLILTGNFAGTTADGLAGMAKQIAAGSGATVGAVAETLNEITASGKMSAEVLAKVAKSAIEMERAGGAAVSATAKEFASLGDAPLTAIVKLNEKYHFLTASVYTQISALQEQGREMDAAKLAQSTYADAIESRIPALNTNLGLLEKAWRGISGAAKGAWDSMVGIGRQATLEEQLAAALRKGNFRPDAEMGDGGIATRSYDPRAAAAEATALYAQIEARDAALLSQQAATRTREAALTGAQELEVIRKAARSKEELIKDSNERIARNAAAVNAATPGTYSDAEIKRLQTAAAEKIRPAAPAVKSQLEFDLEQIKKGSEAQISVFSNAEKIMSAMRSAGMIEEQQAYELKADYIRLISAAQEQGLQAELDRMGKEKVSGKDKLDNDKKMLEVELKLAKLRSDTATALDVNSIQSAGAIRKVTQATDDARASAEAYLRTVERQNQRTLAGIGKGSEFRTEQTAQNQIEDKFTARKTTLDDDLRRQQITKETYDTYLSIAEDTYKREVAMHADTREQIIAKQGDWRNGMSEALANYADSAKNVAQLTAEAFTNAFKGMEDALVKFAMTGKLDFKSLADSIISDLIRVQARAAMAEMTAGAKGFLSDLFKSSSDNATIPMQPGGGYHAGGIVGSEPSFMRSLSSSVFSVARRFHGGGLVGDEVPAVLQKGEGVFTAGQMKAMGGGVTVNVINNANGTQATQQTRQEGGKTIIDVMIDTVKGAIAKDIGSGGQVAGAMERQYGLNRAGGAWSN